MLKGNLSKMLTLLACTLALSFQPITVEWAAAESMSVASAINKSGRQRMLTQRIAKSYMLIGLDVAPDKAQKELDASMALFEEQLLELQEFAPNETVEKGLEQVEDLWGAYRMIAVDKVNKEGGQKLLATNGELLAACHQVVLDIEALSDKQSARMVNIAGRQRMLSQRIALHYMAWVWGYNDEMVMNNFNQSQQEYAVALSTMQGFASNTPEIEGKLKKVEAQWKFSKAGFSQLESGHYVPSVIRTTTNSMLKKMNTITQLYEDLSGK